MSSVMITRDALLDFTKQVLVGFGMPPDAAEVEADVLVWANVRGVDSHGVLRLRSYLQYVRKGQMNPRPNIQITRETEAVVLIEADRALGGVVSSLAMKKAITKAKKVGIGWAVIRDCGHQGAIGYYPLMAARQDMIGLAMTSTVRNMAPYGAKAAGIDNCPMAIAAPAKKHAPLLLDMATSVAAGGKLKYAIDKGAPIPEGWALSEDGNPSTDPKLATILLPFGGYKGSGLSIMIECMTSLMVSNSLLGYEASPEQTYSGRSNGLVAALDIGLFTDAKAYAESIDNFIENIKSRTLAEGFSEILVPGELEHRIEVERLRNGIPLPEGTVRNLQYVAEELDIALPAELR